MAELPSGTVTFLFTDIEGSTARWEGRPEAMRVALARHDALVRATITEHHGHVVKTTGDGFHAAFARAPDALAAALAAQRRLAAEPWGEAGPIRVRMALHTGAAEERDGDYYGPPLNRAARLLATGHGGQVLLSETTAGLVRDALPDGVRLLDLGRHRLKDLTEPECVSQVVAPDLASDFPPLASLDARPHNLPSHPTALLGREREPADVRGLFEEGARLVTLTGPGGTGKTRLGLQVAADLLDAFEHGVFLVDLAPISDPALVPSTVAQALGVRDIGSRPIVDAVKEYLRARSVLLLLDNFEQVLPAASVVAVLLAACPGLAVLATSREPLRLRGEHEYAVLPLSLPGPRQATTAEGASTSPAVALFVQRAHAIRADFALTDENAPAVSEICARLDGLPLGIELAAARVRLLSPEAIARRLEQRLPLLVGGARDLPARQQALRDTIAWSHDLLDDRERLLFRRLCVFVGGWTLDAAEAVCHADGDLDILGGLESLVSKSLVRQDADARSAPRFGMLETIREYAGERLARSGEAADLLRGHAEYYLALAEESEPRIRSSTEQREWLAKLEAEQDNFRAALAWCRTESGDAGIGVRLAGALSWFWRDHGHLGEGRQWLEWALKASDPASASARVKVLVGLGSHARRHGDFGQATALHEQVVALARAEDDRWSVALGLGELGVTARYRGDYGRAVMLFEEALRLFEAVADRWGVAWCLGNLGYAALARGDLKAATTRFEEVLTLARLQGDQSGIAWSLRNLGEVKLASGDFGAAADLCEESLTLFRRLGGPGGIAFALSSLAELACRRGEYARAKGLYTEELEVRHQYGEKRQIAQCLEGLAIVAGGQGQPARAARLVSAASRVREAAGMPRLPHKRVSTERCLALVRSALGESAFSAAWTEGQAMTLEQAVAYALDERTSA
jgi:predicted ATPase/class 3 adenylate cyclase